MSGQDVVTGRDRLRHVEGTGDLWGIWFKEILSSTTKYAGTSPLGEVVWLDWLWFYVTRAAATPKYHRIQIGLASEIPSSAAEMDAAEQLFPNASCGESYRSAIRLSTSFDGLRAPIGRVLDTRGRRIVASWWNGAGAPGNYGIRFLLREVSRVKEGGTCAPGLPGVLGELQAAADRSGSAGR